jgi:hypothetical protein
MAVSSQRFRFLDGETKVKQQSFGTLSNGAAPSSSNSSSSGISESNKNKSALEALQENSIFKKTDKSTLTRVNNSVDETFGKMDKLNMPPLIKKAYDKAGKVKVEALRDRLKEVIKVKYEKLKSKTSVACDDLKDNDLSDNIYYGLIGRTAKNLAKQNCDLSAKDKALHLLLKPKELDVTTENVFKFFINYYSDYLKYKKESLPPELLSEEMFLDYVIAGNTDAAIENVRNANISSSKKKAYIAMLNSKAPSYVTNTSSYAHILKARGTLSKLPLVTARRRIDNAQYEHLFKKLGSYLKQLPYVNLPDPNSLNLKEIEEGLFAKMVVLKINVMKNPTIKILPETGFGRFNFDTILPQLTIEERDFLLGKEHSSDSHKRFGIHPTTAILAGMRA